MRIAVTGACGWIGRELTTVERLSPTSGTCHIGADQLLSLRLA